MATGGEIIPKYSESISHTLYQEDLDALWSKCTLEDQRVLLSILWLSGARPSEILELKRKDMEFKDKNNDVPENYFAIRLQTKKLGEHSEFVITERTLEFIRPLKESGEKPNLYIEVIIRWCKRLLPDEYVLQRGRTTRWLLKVIHGLSKQIGHTYSAYHFRHSVFTHLMRNGASIPEIMHIKGSTDINSVGMYISAIPSKIDMSKQRRKRSLSSG